MGRRKEGEGEERGHLQRSSGHGGSTVGTPDLFVLRASHELQLAGSRLVLDAGCGTGRNSAHLAGLGFQVVSLDLAANKVREARDNALRDAKTCFVNGRLESLPFSSRVFDAVICTHVLEYMDASRIRAALEEFRRVLTKGGLLLLVTTAKEGANLEDAEILGENSYLFKRGGIEVPIHFADKDELEGWLRGFGIQEMLRLSLEYPRAATVSANWGVFARRKD